MDRFLLIDGHNLLHRCFHSHKEMRDDEGQRIGAMHGFLRSMAYIRDQTNIAIENTVVCFDGGHAAFRKEIYPEYKAHRETEDPIKLEERNDLRSQLDSLKELLSLSGCRLVQVGGVEADDLLGLFAGATMRQGGEAIIFTNDKDLHQVICAGVRVVDPHKGVISYSDLNDLWGFDIPTKIPQFLAVTGDASDGVKGVPRMGKVRALKIMPYWNPPTADNPFPRSGLRIAKEDSSWWEKIEAHKELLERNYRLLKIPTEWSESRYSSEQLTQALEQFLTPTQRQLTAFVQMLYKKSLKEVAREAHRW